MAKNPILGSAWRYAVAAAAMLPLPLLQASPARSATVIYYSADGASGWCSGYSHNRAHSCALGHCVKRNGRDCKAVLECSDGWGATAYAASPVRGFGASCGMRNPLLARSVALAKCMVAANAICWTSTTFRTSTTATSESNRQFDLTFFVEAMLQIRGFGLKVADGEFGPDTRAAIEAFEASLGRPPTGVVDDRLFRTLLIAISGDQVLARKLKQGVIDGREEMLARLAYGHASAPAAAANYSVQLAGWAPAERLMALSILIGGGRCTPPALSGELVGEASGGTWRVACAEGSYLLTLDNEGRRTLVRMGGGARPGATTSEPHHSR